MKATETPPASRILWAFGVLFLILGIGYSTLTPIFENSDETLHYPYVKHLADGQGLPVATPGQLWNQEGTQHPLYYAIVAASTFWIDSDNLRDLLQRNPHWLFTEVRALINDNQNLVLHGPMDAFPYRRAALAIQIGRWWSLAFGLLTVAGTFLIARRLFPENRPLIVTATALTALNPQFIRVSSTVSNDSLSAALTTLTILLALKFTAPDRLVNDEKSVARFSRGNWPALLLGVMTGLALLTKLSSLTTLFLVGFIIFLRLFLVSEMHEAPFQKMLRWLAIIGAVTVLLSGWWFVRNYQLYGEGLATETHLELAGRADLSLTEAWSLRAEAGRAYWATFGWGQIRPPEWVYQLFFWFSRIGLIGLALALAARLVQGDKRRPLPLNLEAINFEKIIILLTWAGLNLLLYLRWVTEVGSVSHTRLVFPAIAAISLLLALGWHALLPRRIAGGFSGLVTVLLLALNIYSLGWLIYPAFRPGPAVATGFGSLSPAPPVTASARPAAEVNVTFLDSLKLVGGQVYPQETGQPSRGDTVLVRAEWQVLDSLDKNYSLAVLLLAPDGSMLARRETYPGLGLRPTRYLQPGHSFVDLYPLQIEANVAEPMVARAAINLFDFDSERRTGLPALNQAGHEVTPIVGQLKLVPDRWPEYEPTYPAQVDFGDAIRLVGYDLSSPSSGSPMITLYWESLAPVADDYVVFLHLLDGEGQIVTQADGPPTGNAYPTRWWAPGEIIADTHPLPPTEATTLRLGLYQLDSGRRLSITGSTLPAQDNGVEIELKSSGLSAD